MPIQLPNTFRLSLDTNPYNVGVCVCACVCRVRLYVSHDKTVESCTCRNNRKTKITKKKKKKKNLNPNPLPSPPTLLGQTVGSRKQCPIIDKLVSENPGQAVKRHLAWFAGFDLCIPTCPHLFLWVNTLTPLRYPCNFWWYKALEDSLLSPSPPPTPSHLNCYHFHNFLELQGICLPPASVAESWLSKASRGECLLLHCSQYEPDE